MSTILASIAVIFVDIILVLSLVIRSTFVLLGLPPRIVRNRLVGH